MNIESIAPRELQEAMETKQNGVLVDVRTGAEFREVHAVGAINIPLDGLEKSTLPAEKGLIVYLICKAGSRAKMAYEKLAKAGLDNLVLVEGGMDAWVNEQLPTLRGRKVISLERQVRIAAGSLVLLGVGLSFLHPGYIGISAFVGAGLVFAGITDTCGMGMILGRCPWNR